ncbi:MAG: hypothetical protein HY049_01695 [Acidobacteria bacterium]|nr:hypothetical protein [Acidobacteriota bacterium]
MNKRFQAILLGVVVALAMGGSGAYANCLEFGGFAIFQCADLAFFAPPPVPVTFDPNAVPTNISAVFWQVGFGNQGLNTGLGSAGTGNSALNTFNGNDQGIFPVDIKDAQAATQNPLIPFGATCLSSNNWANSGIDGCADNDRTTSLSNDNDDILNPDYNVYYAKAGSPGYYSYDWHQDYPMAALLKTIPDAKYFAIAAVGTLDRGNSHTGDGPCALTPGTNPSPCDFRPGSYSFKGVINGQPNPVVSGANNVIPWQQVPRPKASCVAGCSGTGTRTINFVWDPVFIQNDRRHIGTTHPAMGGGACVGANPPCIALGPDATRAGGVGIIDLMTKANAANNWAGLVRYTLESAAVGASNLDPNGSVLTNTLVFAAVTGQTDIPQPALNANGDAGSQVTRAGVSSPPDTCYRVHVLFGKKPETGTGVSTCSTANARLGKCGDKGYEAFSLDPGTISCVGGALVSEKAIDVQATKKLGGVTLTWKMTSELALSGFNVYTVSNKGVEKRIGSVPCIACSTGESESYSFNAPATQVKGARSIILEVLSLNGNSRTQVNF